VSDDDPLGAADADRPLGPHDGIIGIVAEAWPKPEASGLELRSGGAVAVDTGTLRATAVSFDRAVQELDAVATRLGALVGTLLGVQAPAWDAIADVAGLRARTDAASSEAARIATALLDAALGYELVEINAAHRAAVLAGDTVRAARLDARMSELVAAHPDAWAAAVGAEVERTVMWPSELVRQATLLGVGIGGEFGDPAAVMAGTGAGLGTLAGAAAAGIAGTGRLERGARLTGPAPGVRLTAVPPAPADGAPQTLGGVTQRMPGAGDSRVRVERYTMPDGSRQFAVYVAGTQSMALGGRDPWDNRSNAELYAGRTSASYAATERALAAAGARPGDVVHAFGHSQGAMIASHLALDGRYDTRTLVTFGSPVAADVGPGTLSVTVRHTDDPVAALAGGGHMASVGAAGSFVAERVAHPEAGLGDATVPAHRMVSYAETAGMLDASTDPRVDGLRGVFADLARAESVEVTEFAAARDEPVSPSWGAG